MSAAARRGFESSGARSTFKTPIISMTTTAIGRCRLNFHSHTAWKTCAYGADTPSGQAPKPNFDASSKDQQDGGLGGELLWAPAQPLGPKHLATPGSCQLGRSCRQPGQASPRPGPDTKPPVPLHSRSAPANSPTATHLSFQILPKFDEIIISGAVSLWGEISSSILIIGSKETLNRPISVQSESGTC